MKIEINKQAEVILTASNAEEREYVIRKYELFENRNAITVTQEPMKRGKYKHKNRAKTCEVIGCEQIVKGKSGQATHNSRAHGLNKDYDKRDTYNFRGKVMPVPFKVYLNKEGKYEIDYSRLKT